MRANLGIGWQLENGNKKIMKYWKKGFYDEPQGGAVEITEEYYNQLLEGQSTGFEIRENAENYPILVKIEPTTIEEFREIKIAEINTYDKSTEVNQFTMQGTPMWIDKDTRLGLRVNIADAIRAEMSAIDLWYGVTKITLSPPIADDLIFQLELYAKKCYDVTAQHIANVEVLTDINEVNDYDYTINYPDKLAF